MAHLAQVNVTVELAEFSCGKCGGVYAINERLRQHHQDHGAFWHCPYCQCSWGYPKSRIRELEEQLAAETRRKESALSRLNETEQREQRVLRKLKRVHAGVCPECKRTFQNLAEHMACKHSPDGKPRFTKRKKAPAFESG